MSQVVQTTLALMVLLSWNTCVFAAFEPSQTASLRDELHKDRYTPSLSKEDQVLANMIDIAMREALFEDAIELSQRLLANISDTDNTSDDAPQYSPATIGKLLVNHGILYYNAGRFSEALVFVEEGLTLIEKQDKGFSKNLVHGLTAKGAISMSLRRFDNADEAFRRAQHIIHREQGVNSEDQLRLVRLLASSSRIQGKHLDADVQNMFSLRVAEKTWGPKSPELLPTLNRLGYYFGDRSHHAPFISPSHVGSAEPSEKEKLYRRALKMFNRSIDIVEESYGKNDVRLLEHLRGLGKIRMLHTSGRGLAKKAYARAIQIVDDHPGSDDVDRAKSLIDMGDLHTVMRDADAARGYYLKAWELMQQTESMRSVANKLFDAPEQLYPNRRSILMLSRRPDAAKSDTTLFVKLSYRVAEDGRVRDIKVIDKNVPNRDVRARRINLRDTYFRPRIVNGELVSTSDLIVHQRYIAPEGEARYEEEAEKEAEEEAEEDEEETLTADTLAETGNDTETAD